MSRVASLPAWAKTERPGVVRVDASGFYPEYLSELEVGPEKLDQYWLQVAYTMMKMEIQVAVVGTVSAPERGGALVILVDDRTKETHDGVSRYALSRYGHGKGIVAGARDAVSHFKRLRGVVPA